MSIKFPKIPKIVIIMLGLATCCYVSLLFYVAFYTLPQKINPADAALVLGAKSFKGDSYNPCLVSRVQTSAKVYETKYVKQMILSGGNDIEDNVNEAETMKKIAQEHQVPSEVLLLEKQATSTYENFTYSKQIMKENGLSSIIVVTEPFHIARVRLVARSLGIDAQYALAEDSPCWTRWKYLSRYLLKEPLAIVSYLISGKIKLSAF